MRYLYCHPLFDERKCAHRFSYQLARTFAAHGLQLERFDYGGTGEAEGQFCDVTMDSLRHDLQAMIQGDPVCLIGTRLGAAVAFAVCCCHTPAVPTLVLIEPVVNGQRYVEYLFTKQRVKDMMTGNGHESAFSEGFCNLEGYQTSCEFIEQIKAVELTVDVKTAADAVFIGQISASSRMNPQYALLAERLKENGIPVTVQTFDLPVFWERVPASNYTMLTERIVEWCR